ncbi:dysbindin-like isoform X2 [Gouania willdenowi]|uniref:dysbindin-like isoform X2 n=1 Tax=Gouania willdenowi TaxID=441366 RepID=UPI00105420EB|nr:dysbindin-like isoform X2 [Gouania willdenowi]
MFEQLRERLHLVQQDFTTGLKTLGDKSRDGRTNRMSRFEENPLHFNAALDVLNRYEEDWFLLHRRTKGCAKAAEVLDGDMVMLSVHWERRTAALTLLQDQLQKLPTFISELDAITENIAHLEGDFDEMESRLAYLENLCSQCDQQSIKHHHIEQLEVYKKKKRKDLEMLEVELDSEHEQKVAELEQAMQQKLKERQKVYEEAFNHDMKQYLFAGYLHSKEPTKTEVGALDEMTVASVSDQEALDDFLNSVDDDTSTSSLTSGPDGGSYSSESLSQALVQTKDPPQWDAVAQQEEDVACEDTEEPLVQSDEEEVQSDLTLTSIHQTQNNSQCHNKLIGTDDLIWFSLVQPTSSSPQMPALD